MPENDQYFGTYPISLEVSEPTTTWYALTPLIGSNGLITTGSAPYVTPIEIEAN